MPKLIQMSKSSDASLGKKGFGQFTVGKWSHIYSTWLKSQKLLELVAERELK